MSKRKCWNVYGLLCPVINTIFYVGITQDMGKRLREHRSNPDSAAYESIQEVVKYGSSVEDIKMVVLAHVHSKKLALRIEQSLIILLPRLVNRTHRQMSDGFWDAMELEFGKPWWRRLKPKVDEAEVVSS